MRISRLAFLTGAVLGLPACLAPTQPSSVETAGALKTHFLAEGLTVLEARPIQCETVGTLVRCDVCLSTASADRPGSQARPPVLLRAEFQRRSSGWRVQGTPTPLPDAAERCAPER